MIVVDASAVVEVLVQSTAAEGIEWRIQRRGESLHAPHLIDVEVVHALRGLLRRREIELGRAEQARSSLGELAVMRHPHRALLDRAWELREVLTACDAVYVALAEALRAPLVTADMRLAKTVGHAARIELFR